MKSSVSALHNAVVDSTTNTSLFQAITANLSVTQARRSSCDTTFRSRRSATTAAVPMIMVCTVDYILLDVMPRKTSACDVVPFL